MKVVIAKGLPAAGLDLLAQRFELVVGDADGEQDSLLALVKDATAIVADPTVEVGAEILESAGSQLRLVANFAVGFDNIDTEACKQRGVKVTNTPDVLTNATAELALGLSLAAARHIVAADRHVRSGSWAGWKQDQYLGLELTGATVGIYGLGRIGARFAELVRPLAGKILSAGGSAKPELEARLGIVRCKPRDLLTNSDLVSLHLPLTADTEQIINAVALGQMKKGAVLVNSGRGGLVDTGALIEALRSGQLRAAGLDVYEAEPDVPVELRQLDNVVLTAHIGSATDTARNKMGELVARNVIAVLSGEQPLTPVA